MAGQITVSKVQLGDSSTTSFNYTMQSNNDGSMVLTKGSMPILTVGADSRPVFATMPAVGGGFSMVRVEVANGFGSTATAIRRFANAPVVVGGDITYADSATLGGTFTINTTGVYAITYFDNTQANPFVFGVTLNSTQLTTSFASVSQATILAAGGCPNGAFGGTATTTTILPAGSVIRAHGTIGMTTSQVPPVASFTITRVV